MATLCLGGALYWGAVARMEPLARKRREWRNAGQLWLPGDPGLRHHASSTRDGSIRATHLLRDLPQQRVQKLVKVPSREPKAADAGGLAGCDVA